MKVPQIWWFHHFLDPMAEICQICPLFLFWKIWDIKKNFLKLTNLYQLTNFVKNCILSGFVIKHMIEIKIVLFNLVISRSGWTFYRFADFQWLIILKQQQRNCKAQWYMRVQRVKIKVLEKLYLMLFQLKFTANPFPVILCFLGVKWMIVNKPQISNNIFFCGSRYGPKEFFWHISYKTSTTWYT